MSNYSDTLLFRYILVRLHRNLSADRDSVYFDGIVSRDHEVWTSVQHARFDQVSPVRLYLNHDIRCFDFEFAHVYDIGDEDWRLFFSASCLLKFLIEMFECFVSSSVVVEQSLDVIFFQNDRLRIILALLEQCI